MEYLIAVLAASLIGNALITIMYFDAEKRVQSWKAFAGFWFEKAVGADDSILGPELPTVEELMEQERTDVRV
jgi:hypothetical protein